ncbi:hypothetical protein THAOC_11758, partial [Thalassiosira oceanica]
AAAAVAAVAAAAAVAAVAAAAAAAAVAAVMSPPCVSTEGLVLYLWDLCKIGALPLPTNTACEALASNPPAGEGPQGPEKGESSCQWPAAGKSPL